VTQSSYEPLKIEIDNIKEDIREIKEESKETNKYFREVIDVLKENSIRQTEILRIQNEQQENQFKRVNNEIAELNEKIDSNIQSQSINTNSLFKGTLKQIGVILGGLLLGYLLYKLGISGGIQK
jgi:hypothetical protein